MAKSILIILILLFEFALATAGWIWVMMLLGFSDKTNKNKKASLIGKILVVLCLAIAIMPLGSTFWVAWRCYFSSLPWEGVPLGFWLPIGANMICALSTAGLIYLYYLSYSKNW